jgi:hypothetical protein
MKGYNRILVIALVFFLVSGLILYTVFSPVEESMVSDVVSYINLTIQRWS